MSPSTPPAGAGPDNPAPDSFNFIDLGEAAQTVGSALEGSGQLGIDAIKPYRWLGQYIVCKTNAMAARVNGNVDRALVEEEKAEQFYKRLPKGWQW